MAVKQYKWKAATTYRSDTSLSYGVTPADQSTWQAENPGTRSGTWEYWFRDANVGPPWIDANSSRLVVSVTENWTVSISNRNYVTVTINSVINSVRRDDARGSNTDTPGRSINIYRAEGGAAVLSLTDTQVATNHTLFAGPLTLDSYTFTLAPGESAERPSLYLHNSTIGYSSYDDIWFGITFLNDLPKEAIPHAVLGPNGQWLSHNRDGGDLRIHNGSRWTDNLKNIDWGVGYGDPPSILKDNKWLNARVLGRE